MYNWDRITTKAMLLEEKKLSVTIVEKKKVFNSIFNFTIRLCEIKRKGGNYIH